MKQSAEKWLADLQSVDKSGVGDIGVEITIRLVVSDPSDYPYVEEIIDKGREIGAAEITSNVRL